MKMWKTIGWTCAALAVAAVCAWAAGPAPGTAPAEESWVRVTGSRVNLRVKPSFENSEVLGQADYDERLEVREMGDEWVGVAPPSRVSFWVSGAFVKRPENVISGSRVNVRTGPSQNHSIATVLERGTAVSPREEVGEWVRIAPPEGTLVWISRSFVEPLERSAPLANPILATPVAEAPAAVAPAAESPAEVAPAAAAPKKPAAAEKPTAEKPASKRVRKAPKAEPAAGEAPALETLPPAAAQDSAALAKPKRQKPGHPSPSTVAQEVPAVEVETPAVAALPASVAGSELPTPIVLPSIPAEDGAGARRGSANPAGVPASFKLIPLDGQGRTATYEGVLRAAPLFNDAPARYRVLRWDAASARWILQCHIYGEASKFRYLQDKSVRVRGREYWLQDVAAPVLMPEQIQELLPTDLAR